MKQKQLNKYGNLERAIMLALAAEREVDLAEAKSANYRGTPSQRAQALWEKSQIEIWEDEADTLISAAASGRRDVEVDHLVNRLLFRWDKGRRTPEDIQQWIQKEVVPFWMK